MMYHGTDVILPSFLPCSVCGTGILPCSVLLKSPCSCSSGSVTLWGWHTISWTALKCLVPLMMLLMLHQPQVHQPWRLDRCDTFMPGLTGSFCFHGAASSHLQHVCTAHVHQPDCIVQGASMRACTQKEARMHAALLSKKWLVATGYSGFGSMAPSSALSFSSRAL